MKLGNQKIFVASIFSFFTLLALSFFLFVMPVPWEKFPPLIKETILFLIGFIWAITMIIIARANSFKLYLGPRYTPEGEVTRDSKNKKIFIAIVIAFIMIAIFCTWVFLTIQDQFPN